MEQVLNGERESNEGLIGFYITFQAQTVFYRWQWGGDGSRAAAEEPELIQFNTLEWPWCSKFSEYILVKYSRLLFHIVCCLDLIPTSSRRRPLYDIGKASSTILPSLSHCCALFRHTQCIMCIYFILSGPHTYLHNGSGNFWRLCSHYKKSAISVSYTHLTLPTNREV